MKLIIPSISPPPSNRFFLPRPKKPPISFISPAPSNCFFLPRPNKPPIAPAVPSIGFPVRSPAVFKPDDNSPLPFNCF